MKIVDNKIKSAGISLADDYSSNGDVELHELLHVFGFADNKNPNSVMFWLASLDDTEYDEQNNIFKIYVGEDITSKLKGLYP